MPARSDLDSWAKGIDSRTGISSTEMESYHFIFAASPFLDSQVFISTGRALNSCPISVLHVQLLGVFWIRHCEKKKCCD